jgi:hypothetical protein
VPSVYVLVARVRQASPEQGLASVPVPAPAM